MPGNLNSQDLSIHYYKKFKKKSREKTEAHRTFYDNKPAGFHEMTWDGKDDHAQRVASGIFNCTDLNQRILSRPGK